MKIIKMTFKADGKFTLETSGFKGTACREATKTIEAAMGEVTGRTMKAEACQATGVQQQQKAGQ